MPTPGPLTGNRGTFLLPNSGEIAQEVAGVESLPGAAEPQEDEGLVAPGYHHVPVGLLPHGKDVGGHVLPPAASKHVDYLNSDEGGFQ